MHDRGDDGDRKLERKKAWKVNSLKVKQIPQHIFYPRRPLQTRRGERVTSSRASMTITCGKGQRELIHCEERKLILQEEKFGWREAFKMGLGWALITQVKVGSGLFLFT